MTAMNIPKGSKIVGDGETYTVIDSFQFRTGYKYVCRRASDGRKVSLDRHDVVRALRSGEARVEVAK